MPFLGFSLTSSVTKTNDFSMTYTKTYETLDVVKKPLELFSGYDVDVQLALLWHAYVDIKGNLTPAPGHTVEDVASAIYDQIEVKDQEQQLEEMRNIAGKNASAISREYAALSPPAKLDTWLKLAQGMENGRIIGYPSSFTLPDVTREYTELFSKLDFEQRINFIRNAIADMGVVA